MSTTEKQEVHTKEGKAGGEPSYAYTDIPLIQIL